MKISRGVANSLTPNATPLEVSKGSTVSSVLGTPLGPSGMLKGTPDWWLSTLPGQKDVRVVNRTFRATFSASAAFTRISGILVPAGMTLIMFRYRFYAELPDVGGRFILARENDFIGLISWRLVSGGRDMLEYTLGDVTTQGFALVHDRLQDGYEPIPLFATGNTAIGFYYTVDSAPSFTVSNVGFHVYGAMVSTKTLDEIQKRL